jgi:hypothetical protein
MNEASNIDDRREIPDIVTAMAGIHSAMDAHAVERIQVSRH